MASLNDGNRPASSNSVDCASSSVASGSQMNLPGIGGELVRTGSPCVLCSV